MATSTLPTLTTKLKPFQLKSDKPIDWCPGCGDYGIVNSIQQAIGELGLEPWKVNFYTGIGCSGKSSQYVQTYGVHTLHGRVLPYALASKMVNPDNVVLAAGGDGDGYGIGGGHYMHAGRRNVDITYIVFDNEVYGLTKGQASPTLELGAQPKSLAAPHISQAMNPIAMSIAAGYTFVARSYAFDAKHLKQTIMAAMQHRGTAIIDVYQPCPTYNDLHPKEYYSEKVLDVAGTEMPRVYYLEDEGYNGVVEDSSNLEALQAKKIEAITKAYQKEERIALGVYWKVDLPTYQDRLEENLPILKTQRPVNMAAHHDAEMKPTTDLAYALEDFII
ncbi:MAG: thiamine pyrophosphate-dependent enzyme [Vampirovibrionales bacterium]